ncbi:SDR family NAD(P)-dependent oxidoreductase [Acetobacterium tundrae]|uniref:SDR family NAD(P)-dependent oxidoreductase n=1 Tax=Acetobacterium tundrae TaxID=132932 RepID=A0ABR6WIP4_9FIRM|nr:SDR family NAD(P)-dependent oxidoreductase [Acetobacterium tundrae]
MDGKFAQPINGAYCASKFAVEALSDALRLELHSNNIQVTVIEPGPMNTNFFKTLDNNSNALSSDTNSCYARFYESDASNRKKQKFAESKKAAKTISDIIMKSRLNARYQVAVPFSYNMITHFPDSLKEYILKNR